MGMAVLFLKHIWSHKINSRQPPIGRVDNAFGDRNLVCTCPPMEMWEDAAE